MLYWDIYEIISETESLNGVMLRGRIRKFALEREKDILVENTEDKENSVCFAVLVGTNIGSIQKYIVSFIPDAKIVLVLQNVKNPVLSKLKVNQEERYTL
jgi:hypothetical protein